MNGLSLERLLETIQQSMHNAAGQASKNVKIAIVYPKESDMISIFGNVVECSINNSRLNGFVTDY